MALLYNTLFIFLIHNVSSHAFSNQVWITTLFWMSYKFWKLSKIIDYKEASYADRRKIPLIITIPSC